MVQAADFFLEANGVKYFANVPGVLVGGSSGSTSRTLEVEWTEYGSPMRLYMYFRATTASWWSFEIRTYDGSVDDGSRWIYYYGEFFMTAVGQPFTGDVDLTSDDSDNGVAGKLHFADLRLETF